MDCQCEWHGVPSKKLQRKSQLHSPEDKLGKFQVFFTVWLQWMYISIKTGYVYASISRSVYKLLQAVSGKIQVGCQEEFPHWRTCQALKRGSGGVSTPQNIQEMTWRLVPCFSWCWGVQWKVRFNDLGGLLQPKWLYDSCDATFGGSLIATSSYPTALHLCFAY